MYKNIDNTTKIKLTESDLMENDSLGKIKSIQQALVDAGYYIGNTGVDGVFGKSTRDAVIKFQKDNGLIVDGVVGPKTYDKLGVSPLTSGKPSQPQTKTAEKPVNNTSWLNSSSTNNVSSKSSSGDYIMVIAFPQYEPKVDKGEKVSLIQQIGIMTQTGELPKKGTYGKIGHAGIALIFKTGDVKLFEFGRYDTKIGQGKVISKNLGKIAKIDKSGNFTNTKEVASKVKANTQGDGPRLDMVTAVVPVPNLLKAKAFAEGPAIREYEAVDMSQGGAANCGTFAIDTAKAGGVPIGDFCTPMPVKMVANFKQFSTDYFTA
jgi:hypothetical protein